MRKIAVLLILTMMFGTLAGCLGSEDDDSSVVGDWYMATELIVELKEEWTLKGAMIQSAAFGDMNFESNEPADITLTLRYDYAILQF